MNKRFFDQAFAETSVASRGFGRAGRRVTICYWICLFVLMIGLHSVQARDTNEINQEERTKKKVFNFEGGSPFDLIAALDRHFRTRLVQILTLPETLSKTRVPKLRVAADDPREVLTLYNRLESPTLGQWRFEPGASGQGTNTSSTNMNVLMLVPDKNGANKMERSVTKVKGVALAGVPEAKWDAMMRDIDQARAYGEEAAKGSGEAFGGTVRVQRDSRVLIVAGSEAYLEMVESLVQAHRVNAEIEAKGVAVSKAPDAVPR